jgi:hypothetical protein
MNRKNSPDHIANSNPNSNSAVAKKEAFYSIKEDKDEQKEFETGPLSVLMQSVQQNTQVNTSPLASIFIVSFTLFGQLLFSNVMSSLISS